MSKVNKVLLLPGDGIGPEVCNEAEKVLDHIIETYNLQILPE